MCCWCRGGDGDGALVAEAILGLGLLSAPKSGCLRWPSEMANRCYSSPSALTRTITHLLGATTSPGRRSPATLQPVPPLLGAPQPCAAVKPHGPASPYNGRMLRPRAAAAPRRAAAAQAPQAA